MTESNQQLQKRYKLFLGYSYFYNFYRYSKYWLSVQQGKGQLSEDQCTAVIRYVVREVMFNPILYLIQNQTIQHVMIFSEEARITNGFTERFSLYTKIIPGRKEL